MVVAVRLFSLAALGVLLPSLLSAEDDYKSPLFESWKQGGELQEEKVVKIEAYTLTLWTQRKGFDVSPSLEGKDTEKFFDDVLDVAAWAAAYADEVLDGKVHEYNLVLSSNYPKDGVSSAIRGTSAVCLNVEKWHERMYSRESRKEVLYQSAAHEFFHVQQYALNPPQARFWREFPAMLFEAAAIVKRGDESGEKGIEYLWGSINSQKKQILEAKPDLDADFIEKTYNPQYTRGLAQTAANIIHEGKRLKGIESICRRVLEVDALDAESFDQVLKDEDVRDGEEPLTLERACAEFRKYLERPGK